MENCNFKTKTIKAAKPLGPRNKRGMRKGRTGKLSIFLAENRISRPRAKLVLYSAEFSLWNC